MLGETKLADWKRMNSHESILHGREGELVLVESEGKDLNLTLLVDRKSYEQFDRFFAFFCNSDVLTSFV